MKRLLAATRLVSWLSRLRLSRYTLIALLTATVIVSAVTLGGIGSVERRQERRLLQERAQIVADIMTQNRLSVDANLMSLVRALKVNVGFFQRTAATMRSGSNTILLLRRSGPDWVVDFSSGGAAMQPKQRIFGPVKDIADAASALQAKTPTLPRSYSGVLPLGSDAAMLVTAATYPYVPAGEELLTAQPIPFSQPVDTHNDFGKLDIAVYASPTPDRAGLVITNTATAPLRGEVAQASPADVDGGNPWLVQVRARAPLDGPIAQHAGVITFGFGMVTTLFLIAMIEVMVRRRNFALALVESRTTELRDSVQALEQVRHALEHLADHDPLTGLLNRRGLAVELERQAGLAARYGTGGVLLIVDLDHFKAVNDTLGHQAGDDLLIRIAQLITEHVRDSDVVARLGGDEFAVILPRDDLETGTLVGQKIVDLLRADMRASAWGALPVTASVGLAVFTPDLSGARVLVHADQALYAAKNAGRDQVSTHRTHLSRSTHPTHARTAQSDLA